jgi:toxin ParE1/3/4
VSGFRLSPEAQTDLDDIGRYLPRNSGAASARYVLGEIRKALRILAENPGIGHSLKDLTDEPVKFWAVFSYLIVYDPSMRPIGVARVIHGYMDAEAAFREKPPRM